ncbi:MAG: hypothetical protein JSS22_03280, partial [Proteobacteria bacterium]|nr:hypothetical protein [Pseudomonadota bacterium]
MKRLELTRRQVLVVAAAGLSGTIGARQAIADAPKRGGKFVYVNLYPNNRVGDDRTGRHPYHLLDLNTRSIYNGLTWVDEQLEVQPELATRWEANPDQTVWDVDLREGVVFHDGRDMTADDVVASYQFHQANTSFAKQIVNIEKTGKLRVRFHLDASNSEFPYIMGEYQLMI